MYVVYIPYSKKLDRYYTGSTSNFETRMKFHDLSPSNKFTGKADDWELFLKIDCECKKQALSIERHIKSMKSKTYIQNLMKYPEMIVKLKKRFASNQ
ncbi:MAG TPA: GIY-YIG nuclease family protein [Flavobacteriaceae bacterium]|nr:GIY-YIG nuclease family protein [Flavobacteriaceae bacterium]